MGKSSILSVLIIWRLISVFTVQTAHVPDEYWQSLEVAHKLAFDYGYLTWEWRLGIRSYLYPFLISLLYKILDLFHLDYAEVLLVAPKLFQALLSGYADFRFYLWTNKSKVALICLVFNWYWYYCATRTLINTLETSLTVIALSIFPWQGKGSTKFIWMVGFLCLARPTAAIIWAPICLYYLWTSEDKFKTLVRCSFIGLAVLLVSILIDSQHYNRLVITPWEFAKFNIVMKISEFYGVHSFLWYLHSGLPVVLGLQSLLLPRAAWKIINRPVFYHKQSVLLLSVVFTLFVYSFLPHKEFRFILPLLPMLIHITTSVTFELPRKLRKFVLVLFILCNLLPGFYFSFLHQRGSLDVMRFLRMQLPEEDSKVDLLFLTPCHSVPLYSHLHRNVSSRFLTCEPNFGHVEDYVDEADLFFQRPMEWLNDNYAKEKATLPSHLIMFDNVIDQIKDFLINYEKLDTIFYAHFTEGNYGNSLVVFKKNLTEVTQNLDEKLDELIVKNLELMEEKVTATVELEKSLRNAQIELAKAKLIRGKEAIGPTQIPIHTENIFSLFELESVITDQNGYSVPKFDISLKQNSDDLQNPLNWFGILVPQSLKSAKKYFQDSIYLSVKVANIQAKLITVLNEIESVRQMKKPDKL